MVDQHHRPATRSNWLLWPTSQAWLKGYDPDESIDYTKSTIAVSAFVAKEMIHYSISSARRAIPSVVDGLKPSQRKVLFSCFKRKLTRELKVASFNVALIGWYMANTAGRWHALI